MSALTHRSRPTLARRLSVAELSDAEYRLGKPLSHIQLREERRGVFIFVTGLIERINALPAEARAVVPWHLLRPTRAELPFDTRYGALLGQVELDLAGFDCLDRFVDAVRMAAHVALPGPVGAERPQRASQPPESPFWVDTAYTASGTHSLRAVKDGWGSYQVVLVGGGAAGPATGNGKGGGGGAGSLSKSGTLNDNDSGSLTITLGASVTAGNDGNASTITGAILGSTTLTANGGSTTTTTTGGAGGTATGGDTNGTGGDGGDGDGSSGGGGGGAGCPKGTAAVKGANANAAGTAATSTGNGGGSGAGGPTPSGGYAGGGGGGVKQAGGAGWDPNGNMRQGGDPGQASGFVPPSKAGLLSTGTAIGGPGGLGGGGGGGGGGNAGGAGSAGSAAVREHKIRKAA